MTSPEPSIERRPRPTRLVAGLTLVAFTFLVSGARPLAAQPAEDPQRRSLIEQGKANRLAGLEIDALGLFQKAHKLAPSPETFGLMAASEYNLNRHVDAEVHLTEALRAGNDPWVAKNRVKLSQLLSTVKSQLGWIVITGSPPGAEVEVAGRAVGRLPLPGRIRVAGGEVNVRVAAPGHKVSRQDIAVGFDQETRINVELERSGDVDEEPSRPRSRNPRRDDGPPPDVDLATSGRGGSSVYRTAGWVTAGAAGVLAVGGIAALLVRESNTKDFNTYKMGTVQANGMCNEAAAQAGGGNCGTYLDRLRAAQTIAVVAFAGAGLAGIVSAILLSAAPSDESARLDDRAARRAVARSPRATCLPSLTELGGSCRISF